MVYSDCGGGRSRCCRWNDGMMVDLLGYVHLEITASAQSGSRGGGHLLGCRAGRRPVGVLNGFIMASRSRFFIYVLPSARSVSSNTRFPCVASEGCPQLPLLQVSSLTGKTRKRLLLEITSQGRACHFLKPLANHLFRLISPDCICCLS